MFSYCQSELDNRMKAGIIFIFVGILGLSRGMYRDFLVGNQDELKQTSEDSVDGELDEHSPAPDDVDDHVPDHFEKDQGHGCKHTNERSGKNWLKFSMRLRRGVNY